MRNITEIMAVFVGIAVVIILLSGGAMAADSSLKLLPKAEVKSEVEASTVKNRDMESAVTGVQVEDIYVACKYYFSKVFNTRENVSRKNICNGYFYGSASMLLLLQSEGVKTNTCIPMDVSTEEIIRGFLSWSDANQDKNKMLASAALLEIFRQNYPCMVYKPKEKDKVKK